MKYPSGIRKTNKSQNLNIDNYANRGMNLEKELNDTNTYYRNQNIAIVYKKPTPITINKVDYPSRLNAVIREAHFKTPSTTDYNGIYKGKYIDFEAKETKNKNSFPLNNIHPHQIQHLKEIYAHGGIGFLIIRFTFINKTYLLTIEKLIEFLETNNRKSIPLEFFKKNAYIIKDKYIPRIDYLEIIKKIYFDGGKI